MLQCFTVQTGEVNHRLTDTILNNTAFQPQLFLPEFPKIGAATFEFKVCILKTTWTSESEPAPDGPFRSFVRSYPQPVRAPADRPVSKARSLA